MLTVGSLFSGIGGLDLGLERAGMKIIWHSEIDKYAVRVLEKHWPEVLNHGDIKLIDWTTVEPIDVLVGGYPCQPFSTAGKRKGKEDSRHLWPYVLDAICALRPRFVVLENVRGHLTLGFRDVLGDLAASGYDAEWQIIPASALGAPHRRDRLVILAYPNDTGSRTSECRTDADWKTKVKKREDLAQSWISGCCSDVADSNGGRFQECESETESQERTRFGSDEAGDVADPEIFFGYGGGYRHGETFSACNPGLSNFLEARRTSGSSHFGVWETEPNVGRVAHGIPSRVDRLRGLGNAVVPQLGELIGRLIIAHDR
jgi:DNA (cytosine-5)-methyltransferase 1